MKRFGQGWVNDIGEPVPTPVGEPCARCGKPIVAGDMGVKMPFSDGSAEKPVESEVTYHRSCLLDAVGVVE